MGPDALAEIGHAFVASQDARLSRGLNVHDQPARPLVSRYAERKRRKGLQAVRDWFYRGRTRRSIKVLSVSPGRIVIGPTDAQAATVLRIRNADERQYGVSLNDKTVIARAVRLLRTVGRVIKVA